MTTLPIHIIDDDADVRHSLGFLLRAEGIIYTLHDDAEAFLAALPQLEPGCILMDLRLHGMQGLELQHYLHDHGCIMPVVMMSGHADVASAVAAMKEGAADFIQKPFSKAELLDAVAEAERRLAATNRASQDKANASRLIETLSQRESQVVVGLAHGKPNKTIAYEIGISPRTIEVHRANAMRKLGVRTLPDMLHLAFLAGLMDD
jgi:two-component system response regulator FixJ